VGRRRIVRKPSITRDVAAHDGNAKSASTRTWVA
jgi:hypothetical protein